jgi:hypothetical protein
MQPNAFLHNGSSIHESNTGGYQTSYVHHIENPVRFKKEIRATIEHGHGNHLCNEMSSVAYWYADSPCKVVDPPAIERRMPVMKDDQGKWIFDEKNQITSRVIEPNEEMIEMKKRWREKKE